MSAAAPGRRVRLGDLKLALPRIPNRGFTGFMQLLPTVPTSVTPRPYQERAYREVLAALRENPSTYVDMATGLGKTILLCLLVLLAVKSGRKVLILVHTDELIGQVVRRLQKDVGVIAQVEKAHEKAETWAQVVVASVQTLSTRDRESGITHRLFRWRRDYFNLVLVDECHHATATTWQSVLEYFRSAKRVGVTATADRLDGASIEEVFKGCAFRMTPLQAVEGGWLVPIWQSFRHVAGLDMQKVAEVAKRLKSGKPAAHLELAASTPKLHVDNLERMAFTSAETIRKNGGKAVVFTASVPDALAFVELLRKAGLEAEAIYQGRGMTNKKRRDLVSAFKDGKFQVVCNMNILNEGFDDPWIKTVCQARFTFSRTIYSQQIGRGTRPLPGVVDGLPDADARKAAIAASEKPYCEVVDFVGNSGEHILANSLAMYANVGEDDVLQLDIMREAQSIVRKASRAGKPVAAHEAVERAREIVEEARKRQFRNHAYQDEVRDPFLATRPGRLLTLFDVGRIRNLHAEGPTPVVKNRLRRLGITQVEKYSRDEARILAERLEARRRRGKATVRQVEVLMKHGLSPQLALKLSFGDAKSKVDELQQNQWRAPDSWAAAAAAG